MKRTIIAAALLGLAAQSANATSSTPGIDYRENRQGHRIYNGIRSGELTYRETARLVRGQAHVHRLEHRAKADGVVTAGERWRIQHAQNWQSRRIWRSKHN